MADKYYEIDPDVEAEFKEVFNKKSFPVTIKMKFIGNSKQKQLIKISKIPDQYNYCMERDLLVEINEELEQVFDDEMTTILYEQQIDKITVDMKTGNIKLIKPDLTTFSGIVAKYGIEKVSRANQIEEVTLQQQADGQAEEVILN
jgi:hypothetical protein